MCFSMHMASSRVTPLCLCLAALLAGQAPAVPETKTYRVLAFGDSNTWGWIPNGGGKRFAAEDRWPMVLQSAVHSGLRANPPAYAAARVVVIDDGLVARRTDVDGLSVKDIEGGFLNGAKTLPVAMVRNAPIDLVIIFLGTNDLQAGIERSAEEVAAAVARLVDLVAGADDLLYSSYPAPGKVWVIVPPALGDLSQTSLQGLFAVGQEESQKLSAAFRGMAEERELRIFDLNRIVAEPVGADGIHLNRAAHRELGRTLAAALLSDLERADRPHPQSE
jgi:lysophospholipase L1-like esterase